MIAGRIGQFEILERLGEGGIGQVHAARDTLLDRRVAIKSLRPALLDDESFGERFLAEAKNLARLGHPNIAALHALLQDADGLHMIMELAPGRTLEAILRGRAKGLAKGLAAREAIAIVGQAADGLAYAHEMGVVHRDIKPANLIVAESGLVKIADFGLARVEGSQRLTRYGGAVGTLAYMSPEQCRGQDVDGRADLYSLAIVLYEMLTGKPPFSAPSDYDLMRAHVEQPPEPPSRRAPGIAPDVEKALMKALAKRPEERFETIAAFREALGAPASSPAAEVLRGVRGGAPAAKLAVLERRAKKWAPVIRLRGPSVRKSAAKKSLGSPGLIGALAGAAAALVLAPFLVNMLRPPSPVKGVAIASPARVMAPVAARLANPNFLPAPPADIRASRSSPSVVRDKASLPLSPAPAAECARPAAETVTRRSTR